MQLLPPGDSPVLLEYLLDDYLETACGLSPDERRDILNKLSSSELNVTRLEEIHCLAVDGIYLLVCSGKKHPKDVFVYHSQNKKMNRYDRNACRTVD